MPVTGIFQPNPLWAAFGAVLVLFVPGWALLSVLYPAKQPRPDWLARLADMAAISVSISALLGLWLFLPGIRLTGLSITAIYLAFFLFGLVQTVRRGLPRFRIKALAWALAALLLVMGMVAWRFYQARGLVLPAWVDSVHHVLIVRVMVEYGGLPPTLAPYLNIPFYYHYGFHLITALFSFAAHLPPEQAVLWFGQVINALVALSVYRLGSVIFPARADQALPWRVLPRALLAALLVAFAFQMPAYYLTWGRYTLLTGLLVLGPAMAAAVQLWRNPHDRWALARLALLIAGLCVVHYLVLLLMGLFLLALGLLSLFAALRQHSWRALPWSLLAATFVGLLAALPWLWRVIAYNLANAHVTLALPPEGIWQPASLKDQFSYLLYLLGPRHSHVLLILAVIGLLFRLGSARLRPLVLWSVFLLLLDLPWGLRLGPFRPDHYAIVMFFPAAMFLADLLISAGEALGAMRPSSQRLNVVAAASVIFAMAGLLLWGMRETRSVINNATNFVTTGDAAALAWVKTSTLPTARFYINSTLWQGSVFRGVDGGYWLLPAAGRASLVPPALYDMGDPAEVQTINDWAQRSADLNGCTPQLWQIIREAHLTHLYLRAGVGSLQPEELTDCPRLKVVYQQAGVFIYEILAP